MLTNRRRFVLRVPAHHLFAMNNAQLTRVASLIPIGLLLTAASAHADTLTQRWSITADERLYVTTANQERGVALNPVTKNVLLLSRAGGPKVYVLSSADGSDGSEATGEPRTLSLLDESGETPISGGTFTLNLVGAANDGAVYACNLATSLGTVRIYRWANDQTDTPVSVAYEGDPLAGIENPGSGQDIRFGDNFAVRGSGPDTQLIQAARNGKYIILYTTTDGVTFTNRTFTTPATISGKIGLGLAFGAGNTIWAKLNGADLLHIELDLATTQARVLHSVPTTIIAAGVTGIGVDPAAGRLAAVNYVDHTLAVFDISDPSGLVSLGDPLPFPTSNANVNGTGAAAILGEEVYGLDTNNGLLAARIERSVITDPPVITTQPIGGSVYEGATFTLAVAVQGTPPFAYQWVRDNSAFLSGATNSQLVLTNLTVSQAGSYSVVVTNAAGSTVSSNATLAVRSPLNNGILQSLWSLNPGDRTYLTADNTQRGLAYNPATGNLLLASRSPQNAIVVLEANTGAEKHQLRTTTADDPPLPIFSGGTLLLNMIGVSEDGVVYAANLVTDASAAAFRLYRWDNDSADTVPTVLNDVPELAVAERWGDTFDVRGRGATTQILLGSRGLDPQEGRKFAVLNTTDGFNFSAQIYTVPELPGAAFGLGIAFGPGNSVFGTANGQPLVHVAFNPGTGTAALARTYSPPAVPAAISFIGFQASSNLLAGVALESPDNLLLYDLADLDNPATLDQGLILPEQPNVNGTGSIDFGGDRVFALDTNHGLRAYRIVRGGSPAAPSLANPRIAGGNFQFTLNGDAGRDYVVQKSTDLKAWSDLGTFRAPATVADPAADQPAFYRALAR